MDPRALTRQSELLLKLVDNVSAMVAYWTSSLHCVFANRAYEQWFGVDAAPIIPGASNFTRPALVV